MKIKSVLKFLKENFVIGLIILLILIGSYWFVARPKQIDLIVPIEQSSGVTNEKIVDRGNVDILPRKNIAPLINDKVPLPPPSRQIVAEKTLNVFLTVLDKSYSVKIEEGKTLFDLMRQLSTEEDQPFNFKYKEHPGLGIFVTEINGMSESPGKYWLYFADGVEAPVGVSAYQLQNGDQIEWRQE